MFFSDSDSENYDFVPSLFSQKDLDEIKNEINIFVNDKKIDLAFKKIIENFDDSNSDIYSSEIDEFTDLVISKLDFDLEKPIENIIKIFEIIEERCELDERELNDFFIIKKSFETFENFSYSYLTSLNILFEKMKMFNKFYEAGLILYVVRRLEEATD